MTLVKTPTRPWQARARRFLARLMGVLKLAAMLLSLLFFWLPWLFRPSLPFILAGLLAAVLRLQRARWLRPGRWRVVRRPWREPPR